MKELLEISMKCDLDGKVLSEYLGGQMTKILESSEIREFGRGERASNVCLVNRL